MLWLPQHTDPRTALTFSSWIPCSSRSSASNCRCLLVAMVALTGGQLRGVEVATRTSSVVSILGSLFIISSYLYFPYFRRPTTRLIFYATWGNIITNAATLVSVSAIPTVPSSASTLCQGQSFLIQWFMLADPFWVGALQGVVRPTLTLAGLLYGLECRAHLQGQALRWQ
jgi:hypothetical protein